MNEIREAQSELEETNEVSCCLYKHRLAWQFVMRSYYLSTSRVVTTTVAAKITARKLGSRTV